MAAQVNEFIRALMRRGQTQQPGAAGRLPPLGFDPGVARMPMVPGEPTTGPSDEDAVWAGRGGINPGGLYSGGVGGAGSPPVFPGGPTFSPEQIAAMLGIDKESMVKVHGPVGGGAMTQGGPADDPRWTNGTWGGPDAGMAGSGAPDMPVMVGGALGAGSADAGAIARGALAGRRPRGRVRFPFF